MATFEEQTHSYLTLPLLVMATIVEFVILATGWKYQQVVCLPQGMKVTFFGIGPIGATILAVELLKLPLAIWTASRRGWQKGVMMMIGLPLICLLTFQLVKDMAVYEMGTALAPASQMLEKAAAEDTKIAQLNSDLAAIEAKKKDREHKLAEMADKKAKAKAELDDLLKHNDDARQDAISLTDYQRKELSDVESREGTIIMQFNSDAEQLTRSLTDLRTRRETELARATKWNAEEARIENAYKTKMSDYANKKAAYEKDKAAYDSANFLKRQLMKEPVNPGVPPEREVNTILKPTLVAELEAQIKSKESELQAVNNKRRDRIAQVDEDARRLREQFGTRSSTKREETDQKRSALIAAQTAQGVEWKAEEKQMDEDLAAAVQKVGGIREELDAAQKRAEGYYEARETAIRGTQVHRIATTVEIVRGLLMGERPMSIKATAKERGDILTDQISMVRIWVYPVLAFIVAFLPTLMVEIGFSTLFMPEQKQPAHRLGFLGQRLHQLYTRAGRLKIMQAERMARETSMEIAQRDRALTEKAADMQAMQRTLGAAALKHEEQLQERESEWATKFAEQASALNQAMIEKDALRDFQHAEIERQVQLRQNVWSDRLAQARQELEAQRGASETERTTLAQEHHKKLLEVSEDWRNQVIQARRQTTEAELALEDKSGKMAYELKEALTARDAACSQLQLQTEAWSLKLTQAKEDAARELEKAVRQEKHRVERQQLEFSKTLRQTNDEMEHQLKQREQELALEFDTRLAREQARIEQDARRREEEMARQSEARIREVETHWTHEVQQHEDAALIRVKQREQQFQAQAEVQLRDAQAQAEEQLRRRELEFERQLDAQARDAEKRLQDELQAKELAFHARMKQREQTLTSKAVAREIELQNQWAADLRTREEEWGQQADSRVRATEARLGTEAQQNEDLLQTKLRQRDQQWQVKLDGVRTELQSQAEELLRRRGVEADTALRELEVRLREETLKNEEAAQVKTQQREQEVAAQLNAQAEARKLAAQAQWEAESEIKTRAIVEPIKAQLARTEKERDEAKQARAEGDRHVQKLEKKLTEASLFLNAWRNGQSVVEDES